jgi:hypothetical protein
MEPYKIFSIDAPRVSFLSETELKKEIKDYHLNRVKAAFFECPAVQELVKKTCLEALKYALDEDTRDWSTIDYLYLNEKYSA